MARYVSIVHLFVFEADLLAQRMLDVLEYEDVFSIIIFDADTVMSPLHTIIREIMSIHVVASYIRPFRRPAYLPSASAYI